MRATLLIFQSPRDDSHWSRLSHMTIPELITVARGREMLWLMGLSQQWGLGTAVMDWVWGKDNLPQKKTGVPDPEGELGAEWAECKCYYRALTYSRASTLGDANPLPFLPQSVSWKHKLRWFLHCFLIRDQCWIVFQCMDGPHCVFPLICSWIFELLPPFDCCG